MTTDKTTAEFRHDDTSAMLTMRPDHDELWVEVSGDGWMHLNSEGAKKLIAYLSVWIAKSTQREADTADKLLPNQPRSSPAKGAHQ